MGGVSCQQMGVHDAHEHVANTIVPPLRGRASVGGFLCYTLDAEHTASLTCGTCDWVRGTYVSRASVISCARCNNYGKYVCFLQAYRPSGLVNIDGSFIRPRVKQTLVPAAEGLTHRVSHVQMLSPVSV